MANSGFCQPRFGAIRLICQPAQNCKLADHDKIDAEYSGSYSWVVRAVWFGVRRQDAGEGEIVSAT